MKNSEAPAYPASESNHTIGTHGLTKRELIAAMAMQGLIAGIHSSSSVALMLNMVAKEKKMSDAQLTAKYAIEYADELLAQLETK